MGTEIDCLIYFTFLSPAFLSVSLQILFSLELFSRLIERSFDFLWTGTAFRVMMNTSQTQKAYLYMNRIPWKNRSGRIGSLLLTFFLLLASASVLSNSGHTAPNITSIQAAEHTASVSQSAKSSSGEQKELLTVTFLDVGQGDAAVLQCGGQTMMIDGGKAKASSYIYSWLKKNQISYLDVMVATHTDADHIGGLSGALNYAKVGTAYCPVTSGTTKTFQSFVRYLKKQGKSITVPKAGDEFSLGGAQVRILGPIDPQAEGNNSSIVLKVTFGDTSFLFTGDAEREEEQELLESGYDLESTVLKVGHHGSDTSTSYLFLRTVNPQYAVISVGADNTYGHPTEAVLSRLRDADVKTCRTDLQGTITAVSDGKKVTFQTERNADINTLGNAGPGQKDETGQKNKAVSSAGKAAASDSSAEKTYVLNTNTHKFHDPDCSSVSQMKEKNKRVVTESRDQIIADGYDPCGRCHP